MFTNYYLCVFCKINVFTKYVLKYISVNICETCNMLVQCLLYQFISI